MSPPLAALRLAEASRRRAAIGQRWRAKGCAAPERHAAGAGNNRAVAGEERSTGRPPRAAQPRSTAPFPLPAMADKEGRPRGGASAARPSSLSAPRGVRPHSPPPPPPSAGAVRSAGGGTPAGGAVRAGPRCGGGGRRALSYPALGRVVVGVPRGLRGRARGVGTGVERWDQRGVVRESRRPRNQPRPWVTGARPPLSRSVDAACGRC